MDASRRRLPRGGAGGELDRLERLQRSAGNAAVGTLMRQPQAAPPKTALEQAGVSGSTRLDSKTAGLVNSIVAASPLLSPFIKGKLPKEGILGSKVKIHDSDAEFNGEYVRVEKITDSLANKDVQKKIAQVAGFFDRSTGITHLRKRSDFGDALHESLHKLAGGGFRGLFEEFLDEGVTAWFTDRLLEEQNQPEHKDLYRDNAACAARLVAATSPTMVAEAYFNQKVGPLAEAVAKKLRIPLGDVHGLAAKGELCDKLPRP